MTSSVLSNLVNLGRSRLYTLALKPSSTKVPQPFQASTYNQQRDTFSHKSAAIIGAERKYGANHYCPLPVVLERGYNTRVWDVEGREYYDFVSACSSVNHGHCHPRLLHALASQASKLTQTSRAMHNNMLALFQKTLCETFGYERALPMNTGVEGGDTAIKLARRWGYEVKGIVQDKARVVFARGNFWGRNISAVSASSDVSCRQGFGPFTPGFDLVDFDNLAQLEASVSNPDVCAFMVEPIQGDAGVIVPSHGYLRQVHEICKKHNVLLIADEVQTGLGRTGKMLCSEHDNVKPDLVVLGKALGGGVYPISAVLGNDEILGLLRPGQHGSTYGGNPLACAIGMAGLEILRDEELCENSMRVGQLLREQLTNDDGSPKVDDIVVDVRGQGLMNALEIKDLSGDGRTVWEVCVEMASRGLLTKPAHGPIIRLLPPLSITEEEVEHAAEIMRESLETVAARYCGEEVQEAFS